VPKYYGISHLHMYLSFPSLQWPPCSSLFFIIRIIKAFWWRFIVVFPWGIWSFHPIQEIHWVTKITYHYDKVKFCISYNNINTYKCYLCCSTNGISGTWPTGCAEDTLSALRLLWQGSKQCKANNLPSWIHNTVQFHMQNTTVFSNHTFQDSVCLSTMLIIF